jgi:hypothetical protein
MRCGVVVVGVLALTACSSPAAVTPRELVLTAAADAKQQGYDEQYELLADGQVDSDDYDIAYRLFRECLTEQGVLVGDPVVSPADGLRYVFEIDANGLAPSVVDEVQLACENEFWLPTSVLYVDTNEQVMDEPLRTAAIDCLLEQGYELDGDESNFPEMIGDPDIDGEQREAAATCVFDAAHELYPELLSLALSS